MVLQSIDNKLSLIERDGQFFLMHGHAVLMDTIHTSSEKTMANLCCIDIGKNARILIGGLGFGYTLKQVLDIAPDDAIVYVAEINKDIINWNLSVLYMINGHCLNDHRVIVINDDVQNILKSKKFDYILMDTDNGSNNIIAYDTNAKIYSPSGIKAFKDVLNKNGRIAYWGIADDLNLLKNLMKEYDRIEEFKVDSYNYHSLSRYSILIAQK